MMSSYPTEKEMSTIYSVIRFDSPLYTAFIHYFKENALAEMFNNPSAPMSNGMVAAFRLSEKSYRQYLSIWNEGNFDGLRRKPLEMNA